MKGVIFMILFSKVVEVEEVVVVASRHVVQVSVVEGVDSVSFCLSYTIPPRKYPDSYEFSCESVVREICLQISKAIFLKTF